MIGTVTRPRAATPRLALHPAHPERICWGCDKYCPADDLACGNGTIRTQHPIELFGDDWLDWSLQTKIVEAPSLEDARESPSSDFPARN